MATALPNNRVYGLGAQRLRSKSDLARVDLWICETKVTGPTGGRWMPDQL